MYMKAHVNTQCVYPLTENPVNMVRTRASSHSCADYDTAPDGLKEIADLGVSAQPKQSILCFVAVLTIGKPKSRASRQEIE